MEGGVFVMEADNQRILYGIIVKAILYNHLSATYIFSSLSAMPPLYRCKPPTIPQRYSHVKALTTGGNKYLHHAVRAFTLWNYVHII